MYRYLIFRDYRLCYKFEICEISGGKAENMFQDKQGRLCGHRATFNSMFQLLYNNFEIISSYLRMRFYDLHLVGDNNITLGVLCRFCSNFGHFFM